MPDIQFFDAPGFFTLKIGEVEQLLIGKKAELEILLANVRNLDAAIRSLGALAPEHQRAILADLASLREVMTSTERSVGALQGEIEMLSGKLAALLAARNLLEVDQPR